MNEEVNFCFEHAKEQMNSAIIHLEHELIKIRAGKASPQMLESVYIDYYGTNTALSQIASINTPDPRTIVVQPWEKNFLNAIDKAIRDANLGFNPINDGSVVRIPVPPLTEDRRKDLVKKAKAEAEASKVSIRNIRRDANETAKKLSKGSIPEDVIKKLENDVQELTNQYITKIDKILGTKEADIMTV
ncbi:MAG: ribosome recycling factor [Bacteroidota bacterium]|nr:ribosome recycling factor [Bacteroidota bacterium]